MGKFVEKVHSSLRLNYYYRKSNEKLFKACRIFVTCQVTALDFCIRQLFAEITFIAHK